MRITGNDTLVSQEAIAEQAAQWLLVIEDEHSVQVEKEFQQWLKQSALHQKIFAEHQTIWSSADQLTLDMFEQDLHSLAVVDNKKTPKPRSASKSLIDSIVELFTIKSFSYSVATMSSFALVFLLISLPATKQVNTTQSAHNNSLEMKEYHSQFAENKTITLEDGSIIALSSKTRITVDFKENQRDIYLLEGEALFTVAKDKTRPFIVHNQNRSFQALGTIFNVRESKSLAEIHVLEGVVKVNGTDKEQINTTILNAGEAIKVKNSGKLLTKSNFDINAPVNWQSMSMNYIAADLSDVVFDLKRYSKLNIYIQDQNLSTMKYTGRLAYDNAEEWLFALPYIFPVEIQRYDNTVVIAKK